MTLGCALALALFNLPAMGHRPDSAAVAALQQAEASMLITGELTVDPAGHVTGYSIDKRSKVPDGVTAMIDQSLPHWSFEPVQKDGSPVPAKATMRLLVVANQADETHYRIAIRSAAFDDAANAAPSAHVTTKKVTVPGYPGVAFADGVGGTVYVRLKIDRSGHVADEIAEQVNLRSVGSTEKMEAWRAAFSRSALDAAAKWTFHPPTTGNAATRDYWDVVVPVIYTMTGSVWNYGRWQPYIPGTREVVPWADPDDSARPHSHEALADGSVHLVGSGLHLLTPLGDG